MNRISIAALIIGLGSSVGLFFATAEVHKLSASVSLLEEHIAGMDKSPATPSSAPEAGKAGGSDPAKAPATMAEVSSELVRLRKEMAEVKSAQETSSTSPTTIAKSDKTPAPSTTTVPVPEELRRAVDQVLAEKDEAAKKEEAKRAEEFQARRTQELVTGLATQLGLTEQQKTQVNDIVTKEFAAMRDAWTNRQEGDDVRAKTDEIRKGADTQIKSLLSAEQQTKYDEVARSLQRGGGFGGGGRGGNRGGQGGGGPGNGGN